LKELFERETIKEITLEREKKVRKFVSIGACDIVTPVYKLEQFVDDQVTKLEQFANDKVTFDSNTRIISSDYPFKPFVQSGLANSNMGRKLVHAIYTTIIRLRAATRLKKLKAQCKIHFTIVIREGINCSSKLDILSEYAKTLKVESGKTEQVLIYKDFHNGEVYNVPSYASPRKIDMMVYKFSILETNLCSTKRVWFIKTTGRFDSFLYDETSIV
jgi:hypothetical protein